VTAALQRETRTIPIVFVAVSDPVGAGFVTSLTHPGGNLTGFIYTEAAMAGKWLELLTEIAPGLKRVVGVNERSAGSATGLVAGALVNPAYRCELDRCRRRTSEHSKCRDGHRSAVTAS
jgi:hypothetical protein